MANNFSGGWRAALKLGFSAAGERTVLLHRERHGPLTVQRSFYPEGNVCHVYLLHPPGGVVGGDELHIDVDVDEHCHSLITTPGATKFYRSAGGQAQQFQNLKLAKDSCLEWLPQENIFFPGAHVTLTTRVDLTETSRAAIWEINCFGRPSIGESFSEGNVVSRFELWRDDKPLLLECLRVNEQYRHFLSSLQSKPVNATLIMTPADADALANTRACLTELNSTNSAATLIDDLLVVRYLGSSTEDARNVFITIWSALRQSVIGKAVNVPRIWNT